MAIGYTVHHCPPGLYTFVALMCQATKSTQSNKLCCPSPPPGWRQGNPNVEDSIYNLQMSSYPDQRTAYRELKQPPSCKNSFFYLLYLATQALMTAQLNPICPVQKSNGEWRLTVDYRGLNEVTPPLSAAVPDMLELQYELESKAAKWHAKTDIANAFFSIPLAAEYRPQFAFIWRGVQYTWNRLPQVSKHSPTVCRGPFQTSLEQGGAPEHLQYIDDIIVRATQQQNFLRQSIKYFECF
ncbi:hypothetical protein llap_20105 [Limosa lapponica baueri]|uniref:ribonuclease H n=1 Tax=Limosa lapponica baueri TaxID=1758121 RepID=A0A2I0T707_LIMLA|nr:hypothetical protein llap_20105 [Limosa lapponica baueri]